MIIKDLWIIEDSGLCLYHYHATFSDYEIDSTLFSGFIAALSSFTECLAQKQIDFLKLQNDELYFISLKEIIVVSVMSTTGGEQHVIKQLLKFVGDKFLKYRSRNFSKDIRTPVFDSKTIQEQFVREIGELCVDEALYDDIKREMVNDLFNQVIQGKVQTDVLCWKIIQLYSYSTPQEIEKLFRIFDNLKSILPTITDNISLRARIKETFQAVKSQLHIALQREESRLLVLCENDEIFNKIFDASLPYRIVAISHSSVSGLQHTLENWVEPSPYNVLIAKFSLTTQEAELLSNLELQPNSRMFVYLQKISKEVRGMLSCYNQENIMINNGYNCAFEQCSCKYDCSIIEDIIEEIVSQFNNITLEKNSNQE